MRTKVTSQDTKKFVQCSIVQKRANYRNLYSLYLIRIRLLTKKQNYQNNQNRPNSKKRKSMHCRLESSNQSIISMLFAMKEPILQQLNRPNCKVKFNNIRILNANITNNFNQYLVKRWQRLMNKLSKSKVLTNILPIYNINYKKMKRALRMTEL